MRRSLTLKLPNPDDDYLLKMEFDTNDLATFYFCGIPTLGKNPTDTESWALTDFSRFAYAISVQCEGCCN